MMKFLPVISDTVAISTWISASLRLSVCVPGGLAVSGFGVSVGATGVGLPGEIVDTPAATPGGSLDRADATVATRLKTAARQKRLIIVYFSTVTKRSSQGQGQRGRLAVAQHRHLQTRSIFQIVHQLLRIRQATQYRAVDRSDEVGGFKPGLAQHRSNLSVDGTART